MAGTIFINYRREDDPGNTGRVYDRLEEAFGKDALFMDVEGHIRCGDDYVDILRAQIAQCDVLLAIVGPRWLTIADENRRRRLDNPDDWVRVEIVGALEGGKRVIPVLVGGAEMPRSEDLPDDLKPFARRQAIRITVDRFKADVQGLVSQLEAVLPDIRARRTSDGETERAAQTDADRSRQAQEATVRTGSGRGSFGLALKIAVAAGLAGAALVFKDRLLPSASRPAGPSAGTTGATGPTGSTGSSTASAPAKPEAPDLLREINGHPPAIMEAPQLLREIKAHPSDIVGLAVAEDGRSIVSAARGDASLKVWSLSTGALLRTIALDNRQMSSLALSGRRVAIGHTDGTVTLYDFERGERVAAFKRNDVEVWSVAFLGSGDRFAAAGHDYKIAVWDVANPARPKFVLEGHESAAKAVAYSVHGPWIATGSADKTVRLYEADTQDHIRTYRGNKDFVTALTFSPDGKTLAAATLDGDIRLYQTNANRARVSPINAHRGRISALAYSANGEYLASAGEDGAVQVWTGTRGRSVLTLPGLHTGGAMAVAFAPAEGGPRSAGKRLVAAGADGMIRVWQLPASRRTDDE